jgi:hypothetical protein
LFEGDLGRDCIFRGPEISSYRPSASGIRCVSCGDANRPAHDDVPGQQFGDAIDWMTGDAAEHLVQKGFGIEPIELGGLCRPPNYAERFWKQPVVCAHLRPVERTSPQFHSA